MTNEERKAKKKERDRKYYERHKEQVNERNRKWRLANPEKYREYNTNYNRRWRAANRELSNRYARKYYAAHRDAELERHREWFRRNPDKLREYNRRRSERRRIEKINKRRALFESRLRHVPKRDVLERIYDLLEWRGLRRSLRMTSFDEQG